MQLLCRVETYLKRSGIPPTRFGREAAHDPRFVFDLREGREPRARVRARTFAYLDREEARLENITCSR